MKVVLLTLGLLATLFALPPLTAGQQRDAAPFCGMQYVSKREDYETMKTLGVNVILQKFDHDAAPTKWQAQLDEAQANGFQVVAVQWPQGWEWNDGKSQWEIDAQAESFLRTTAGHPATLAVFGLQEPYWRGCPDCGLTTAEQQQLYRAIKAIADVPIYSELGDITFWQNEGQATALTDGVCDYCGVWFYPSFANGNYYRDEFVMHLNENIASIRALAPNSKLVWLMQAFAHNTNVKPRRMPTADELHDMNQIVAESNVDGVFWYVWEFGKLYQDFLSRHPELLPVVASAPFCAGSALPTPPAPPTASPSGIFGRGYGKVIMYAAAGGTVGSLLLLGGGVLWMRPKKSKAHATAQRPAPKKQPPPADSDP
jgi:hypothetical protein